jgi:hypothetical protein
MLLIRFLDARSGRACIKYRIYTTHSFETLASPFAAPGPGEVARVGLARVRSQSESIFRAALLRRLKTSQTTEASTMPRRVKGRWRLARAPGRSRRSQVPNQPVIRPQQTSPSD